MALEVSPVKHQSVLAVLFTLVLSCGMILPLKAEAGSANAKTRALPRIAYAGLSIESSTFSPAVTDEAAFHAKYGADIFTRYPFFADGSPIRQRAEWVPILLGKALPGGAVTREAYESLVQQTSMGSSKMARMTGWSCDTGAIGVVGLDDPEGDFLVRIRQVIGKKPVVSTSMDLHGNVSPRLAENTDLITCYRILGPHEDAIETRERGVEKLLERLESGKGKPAYKALIAVPILLPGEKTSTRIEPGKSVYAAVAPAAAQDGIVNASIWIGYAWADEPRNHAAVMVTGDDKEKVVQTAEQLARRLWDARQKFDFVAPTEPFAQALAKALASDKHPFFISDMGDNPTAGGAGDVTWTLTELLKRPEFKSPDGPSLIYASIPGPNLIEKVLAAGVGGHVDGYAGAEVDSRYAPPVHIVGTVESIQKGDKDAEVEASVVEPSMSSSRRSGSPTTTRRTSPNWD